MQARNWPRRSGSLSLVGWLRLACSSLLGIAIAATPGYAYVARADVTLDIQLGESYSAFMSRAETVARAAIQRSLDRDMLVSEVSVMVVGQRQGQSSPVLRVQVSRNQWRGRPDSRYWATYLPSARGLLGFDVKPATPNPTPTPANPTGTPPARPVPASVPTNNAPPNRPLPPTPTGPNPGSPATGTGVPPTTPLPPTRPTQSQ